MSSRVRIIGSHPTYGVNWGAACVHCIEESWVKKYKLIDINQIAPLGYQAWAHWKRALWMARHEGNWMIKAFREPRAARSSRSLYGRAFLDFGLIIPKRKGKFVAKVGYKFKVGFNKPERPKVRVIEQNRILDDMDAIIQGQRIPVPIPVPGPNGDMAVQAVAIPQQQGGNIAFQQWGWANAGANNFVVAPGMQQRIEEEQARMRAARAAEQERRRIPMHHDWVDDLFIPDPPDEL